MPTRHEMISPFVAWLGLALIVGVVTLPLWRVGKRGWPPQRRRALSWGGTHVAAAFTIFWFMPFLVLPLLPADQLSQWVYGRRVAPEIANNLAIALASTLALPLQLLAWRGLLSTVEPAPIMALSARNTVRDIRMGLVAWFAVTPVVYMIHLTAIAVNVHLGGKPDEHPLLQALDRTGTPLAAVLLLSVEALIAAPVREELLFRGILQPWLAERTWGGDIGLIIAAIVGVALHSNSWPDWHNTGAVLSFVAPALLVVVLIPVIWLFEVCGPLRRMIPIRDPAAFGRTLRAVAATAAIFANVHGRIWPSPVPLLFLGLALGWLAVRTQGVTGPIVMHALFNSVAISELWFR